MAGDKKLRTFPSYTRVLVMQWACRALRMLVDGCSNKDMVEEFFFFCSQHNIENRAFREHIIEGAGIEIARLPQGKLQYLYRALREEENNSTERREEVYAR